MSPTALGLLLLAAWTSPAAARCRLHGRALHRASRERGVTTLHPRGLVPSFLDRLSARLAPVATPPVGGPASGLAATGEPAARLRALAAALIVRESRGVHRRADGSLLRSRHGEHVGFLQVGRAAAERALWLWRARGLSPPTAPGGGVATPERRRAWSWNLRLGTLYLLDLLDRIPAELDREATERRLLRALAAYVAGPAPGFLHLPPPALREAVGRRPEVKRYLRHAAFALGLLLEPGDAARWRLTLEGRLTREAGGWAREREEVRAAFHRLLRPCSPAPPRAATLR